MSKLSWFWRLVLAAILIAMLAPLALGVDSGLSPESPWSGQVEEVPLWLRVWLLGVLFPVFLASLFFVPRSLEARAAAAGFILSHVPMAVPLFDVTVGVVGLMHLICWGPALVLLSRKRAKVDPKTPFGLWVHAMLGVLAGSLAFDLRDALLYFVF
ncbi:MAG: hypothetical protein GY910_27700 [bacterium]|nr:hypothetical protein [Deltaproteobacteria bacterium]MCP4908778.1 hypothetical protein [bacterium]